MFIIKTIQTRAKISEIIGFEIVKKWVPLVWEAFEDYRLNSLYLSGREAEIIRLINQGKVKEVFQSAENNGWLEKKENGTLKQNLERIELEEKLEKLNMNIPWKEFYK